MCLIELFSIHSFDFLINFLLDFLGKEYEDSELVSHLLPGTENRKPVLPFACLSNITDQDLFNINVVNDVYEFWHVTLLYAVYSFKGNYFYVIVIAKCQVKQRHLAHSRIVVLCTKMEKKFF